MKLVRVMDGMLCFAISVFFGVAIFQDFFLASVVVTDITYPAYKSIINGTTFAVQVTPDVCRTSTDASVTETCQCFISAGKDATKAYECIGSHGGLPSTQVAVGHINPNFILFYVFAVAAMYQLVLRNAMGVDLTRLHRDVQFGVTAMCIVLVIACVLSLFQYGHGVDL